MKKQQQLRQGDVLLQRVRSIPKGATKKPTDQGRVILAYGEVTGHAHAVVVERSDRETVEAFLAELDGVVYLSAPAGARVVHEEHGTIPLEAGTYKVIRQREWTDEDEPRQVAD